MVVAAGSSVIARDAAALSPSIGPRAYPLVVERAAGIEIEATDGRRYLDFMAGIAVCSTGHCHPRVVAAITRQAQQFIHVGGTDVYYEVQVNLAERLQAVSGFGAAGRVFFANSGTEAVEAAIKLARYHRRCPGLISFIGGFHGRTLGALGATASKGVQRGGFFAGSGPVYHGFYPNSQPLADQPSISLDFALHHLREVVLGRLVSPDEVAAILVEPVQGEGGYVFPPPDFLPALRALCDETGILLILDEVQTGIGRSGRWLATDHVGVRPDILVLAKGLASGLPIGAMVAEEAVMDWPPGSHANTFGGNPIACAAALATLDVIEEEGLLANATARGAELVAGLRDLALAHPAMICQPRGLGLLVAADLVGDSPEDTAARRDSVVQRAFERGLLILPAGRRALRLIPPLIVTSAQVAQALEILDACLSEMRWAVGRGPITP